MYCLTTVILLSYYCHTTVILLSWYCYIVLPCCAPCRHVTPPQVTSTAVPRAWPCCLRESCSVFSSVHVCVVRQWWRRPGTGRTAGSGWVHRDRGLSACIQCTRKVRHASCLLVALALPYSTPIMVLSWYYRGTIVVLS